jgi:hypothetical protein
MNGIPIKPSYAKAIDGFRLIQAPPEEIKTQRTTAAGQYSGTSVHSSSMSYMRLTCMQLPKIRHQPCACYGGEKPHGSHGVAQMLTLCSASVPVDQCRQATAAIIQPSIY